MDAGSLVKMFSGTKLSIEDVQEIRRRLARGDLHKVIAWDFKVAHRTIDNISRGKSWWWLPKEEICDTIED